MLYSVIYIFISLFLVFLLRYFNINHGEIFWVLTNEYSLIYVGYYWRIYSITQGGWVLIVFLFNILVISLVTILYLYFITYQRT